MVFWILDSLKQHSVSLSCLKPRSIRARRENPWPLGVDQGIRGKRGAYRPEGNPVDGPEEETSTRPRTNGMLALPQTLILSYLGTISHSKKLLSLLLEHPTKQCWRGVRHL